MDDPRKTELNKSTIVDDGVYPPETAPENIPVSLRNFHDAEQAEHFGPIIASTVRTISRCIDLERLDGITVSFDYDDALAQLDRGFQPGRPLTRTADDHIQGVAMAAPVLRDGVVKAHLVFSAPVVFPLEDEGAEGFRQALYLVAHECAHIEDIKHRDDCFPGTILQREITDIQEKILYRVAGGVWEEYAACRTSAIFGAEQATIYEESFIAVVSDARLRANDAIQSYRRHGDVDRVIEEAGKPLCQPLLLAAYLTGHLDGRNSDMDEVPNARDALAESPYADFVQRLWEVLRELWQHRGRWSSPAEFKPLNDIARDLLAEGGLILRRLPGGQLHVDIP